MSKHREAPNRFYSSDMLTSLFSLKNIKSMFGSNAGEGGDVRTATNRGDYFLTEQQKNRINKPAAVSSSTPNYKRTNPIRQSGLSNITSSASNLSLKPGGDFNPAYRATRRSKTVAPSSSPDPPRCREERAAVDIAQGNGLKGVHAATSSHPAASTVPPLAQPAVPSTALSTVSVVVKPAVLCCDKCDGKHETQSCPYYKKQRDAHPDAQKNKLIGGTSSLPLASVASGRARVVPQPGDGSCLFHSMSYGLKQAGCSSGGAAALRAEICRFISSNPSLRISDTPLQDWVRWDSGSSVAEYARTMSRGSWGGGIEMACLSQLRGVNVHVYEAARGGGGFKRISAFDHHASPESKPVIRVLYRGGVHYGECKS